MNEMKALYSLGAQPRQFFTDGSWRYAVGAVPQREPMILNLPTEWFMFVGSRLLMFWILRHIGRGEWKAFLLKRPADMFPGTDDDFTAAWELVHVEQCDTQRGAKVAASELALAHIGTLRNLTAFTPRHPVLYWRKYLMLAMIFLFWWVALWHVFSLGDVMSEPWFFVLIFLLTAICLVSTYVLAIIRLRRYGPAHKTGSVAAST